LRRCNPAGPPVFLPGIALGLARIGMALGVLTAAAFAQDTAGGRALAVWQADLAALGCYTEAGHDPVDDLEALLLVGLSWGDLGAEQLQGWTAAGITDHLARGGTIAGLERAEDWTGYFLAQMEVAHLRFRSDAARLGTGLCPILDLIAGDDIARFALADREKPGRYRTHFRLAQQLLMTQGCLDRDVSGGADGAFGPVSRTAWNAAARAAGARDLLLQGAAKPVPGQVVDLAALRGQGRLCAPDPGASETDGRALLAVAADCVAGRPFGQQTLALVRDRLHAAADLGDAALGAALSGLGDYCEDRANRTWPDAGLVEVLIDHMPPLQGQASAALARAGAVARGLVGTGGADGDAARQTIVALAGLADRALRDPLSGAQTDFAVALMAQVFDLDGGPETYEVPDLLDLVAAGLDGLDLDPALRAEVIRRYRRLGLEGHADESRLIRAARFLAARDRGTDPAGVAQALIDQVGPSFFVSEAYGGAPVVDDGLMRAEFTLTFDGMVAMNQLATLAALSPEALDVVRQADPIVAFSVGTLILEGYAEAPRSDRLTADAAGLIARAAEGGLGIALLRRAQMLEQGLGTAADPAAAVAAFQAAADAGQPAAHLALAEAFERGTLAPQDWDAASLHWRAVLGLDGGEPMVTALARVRAGRAAGRPYFTEGPGATLIAETGNRLRAMAESQEEGLQGAPDVARGMARAFLAPEAGIAPDFAEAANWFRLADALADARADPEATTTGGDRESRAALAHLLLARPDLAEDGESPAELLRGTPEGFWLSTRDPQALADEILRGCTFDDAVCIAFQHRAATGGVAMELVAQAHHWLVRAAVDEAAARATTPPYERPPVAATVALLDALAFFGDWTGAADAARSLPAFSLAPLDWYEAPPPHLRNAAFRRTVARIVAGGGPADPGAFLALLRQLAGLGDAEARGFLETVTGPIPVQLPGDALSLDQARAAYAVAEPLGRESRGLAFAARRLSALEADAGNRDRALELELIAMGSDLAAAASVEAVDGPLPAALTRVCVWSKASETLDRIGRPEMALALARQAVNTLQEIRAGLTGVPEDLQLCFRDQVSDHYRWLADLLIRQGRAAEADQVLSMLKGYETWRFGSRDAALQGASLDLVPVPQGEPGLMDAMAGIAPTVTAQALRRRDLLLLARDRALSGSEADELALLETELGALAEQRRQVVAGLIAAAADLGRRDVPARLDAGASIKRQLRAREGRRAAALQYVVLPDRIGLVLTTPVSQRAFVIDRLDGAPLRADALAAAVAGFRAVLRDPASDPRAEAQRLSDLLLPPEVLAELQDGGIDTLILSPDGPLRYIPFAALRAGDGWLVERYALTEATESATPAADRPIRRISGFGTSRAIEGFSALPGVRRELDALVREGGGDEGLLDGSVTLDEGFTRRALSGGLVFGDAFTPELGVVHIASHFSLAPTEADSFLLLGDGERLTVADLRGGFGIDMDFSEVGLLTLSACETAFGRAGADGSELESFAAIAQGAGARSVVATLWPVADGATAALMEEFYARQRGGAALDLALAESQRAFLSGAPVAEGRRLRSGAALRAARPDPAFPGLTHPFFWAPVVLLEGA
jgi:CHAT domain-containing protein